MRRRIVLAPALLALLTGACGSSSHHATSASNASTSAATTTSAPTATSTTPSSSTKPSSGATSTAPGPRTPGSTGSAPAGGQEKIRLPANFTIRAGGAMSPSSVSSPAFLALDLTVASADRQAHRILVRTPHPYSFSVPAGGRVSTLISGLRPGQYAIAVDGVVRATLSIGGEPGP